MIEDFDKKINKYPTDFDEKANILAVEELEKKLINLKKINEQKLVPPPFKEPPKWLPKSLYDEIDSIIKQYDYSITNPYESYYLKLAKIRYSQNPDLYKPKSILEDKKMNKKEWNEYLNRIKVSINSLVLITDESMKDVWLKLDKINTENLPKLFNDIKNMYFNILPSPSFNKDNADNLFHSILSIKTREYKELIEEDPSHFLDLLEGVQHYIEVDMELIAPDGADCLDGDERYPYNNTNWNLKITDMEYSLFKNILNKIIEKIKNRIEYNKQERLKINEFLNNPISRKQKLENADEILFIKKLYLKMLKHFKKPCYNEISIIDEVLFNGCHIENDIMKLVKPVKEKIKKLENEVKNKGFVREDSDHNFDIEHTLFDKD